MFNKPDKSKDHGDKNMPDETRGLTPHTAPPKPKQPLPLKPKK